MAHPLWEHHYLFGQMKVKDLSKQIFKKVLKIPSQGKNIKNNNNEYLSTHCKAPYYKRDRMYSKSSQYWLSSKAQYPGKE